VFLIHVLSCIATQGFGNVGYHAALYFEQFGGKVVGVVEHNSAVYNPAGMDVKALKAHMQRTGSLQGFAGAAEEVDEDMAASFMEKDCDVLILVCPLVSRVDPKHCIFVPCLGSENRRVAGGDGKGAQLD